MLKLKNNKKRGFTLIELIVVIAILGILAAILVPSMLGIVNDSRDSVNLANARSAYSAAQQAYVQLSTESTDAPAEADVLTKAEEYLGGDFGTFSITLGTDGVASATFEDQTYTPGA